MPATQIKEISLKKMKFSPTISLFRTLTDIVQMLYLLNNYKAIKPSTAITSLTVFCGAVPADMRLLPLVSKLEQNSMRKR
jgi:flagellar motor component MotA